MAALKHSSLSFVVHTPDRDPLLLLRISGSVNLDPKVEFVFPPSSAEPDPLSELMPDETEVFCVQLEDVNNESAAAFVSGLQKQKFKNYSTFRTADSVEAYRSASSGVSIFPYSALVATRESDVGKIIRIEAEKEDNVEAVLKRIKGHGAFPRCFSIVRDPAHAILLLDHAVTDVDVHTILSITGVRKLQSSKGVAWGAKSNPKESKTPMKHIPDNRLVIIKCVDGSPIPEKHAKAVAEALQLNAPFVRDGRLIGRLAPEKAAEWDGKVLGRGAFVVFWPAGELAVPAPSGDPRV
jgi:hypothetical protein